MYRICVAGVVALIVAMLSGTVCGAQETAFAMPAVLRFQGDDSGALKANTKHGIVVFPLKHTDVSAAIAGHIARVTVKQSFENPLDETMEAVYTFPLSDTGAVDEMVMKFGGRTIHATIKKKEEAKQIYEKAKTEGHTAALLEQQRPNVFTQAVANIPPHQNVDVEISYVDMLPYQDGKYTFAFPMVVGPRFSPSAQQVPDAAAVSPPLVPQGTRSGTDVSIHVDLQSPVPVSEVESGSHEVKDERISEEHHKVELLQKATISNKDYVLTWRVADTQLKTGYLVNAHDGKGFFNITFIPPKRPTPEQIQPKEMVFLIDCSGSQHGLPLQKAKEVMQYCIDHMNPQDTFQVVSFNNVTVQLFEKPQLATAERRTVAKHYLEQLEADGATWMAPAVEAVCAIPPDAHRLRIVTFMTDGLIGNDFEVIGLIKKLRKTSRWFPFGTGNGVNRFLIDNIAKEGGGEPDYVYLQSSAEEAGKKFYDRIASPVLTDVNVDFGDLKVKDVFPRDLADVWAQKPLYVTGRFVEPGAGTVRISGFSGGKPYEEKLKVVLPKEDSANASLGSLWARAFVDYMTAQDWLSHQPGAPRTAANDELKDEITRVALEHHIMTQYTSFVAVDESTTVKDGKKVTVEQPVEVPEGMDRKYLEPQQAQKAGVNKLGLQQVYGLPVSSGSLVMKGGSDQASEGTGFNSTSIDPGMQAKTSPLSLADRNAPHVHRARKLYSTTGNLLVTPRQLMDQPDAVPNISVSDEEIAKLAKQKLSPELLEWFNKEGTGKIRVQMFFDTAKNVPVGYDTTSHIVFDPPSLVMNIDRHALRYYLALEHLKSVVIVKDTE